MCDKETECINIFAGEEKWTKYNRKCPECGRTMYYSKKNVLNRAIRDNSKCRSCCNMGKEALLFGEKNRIKKQNYEKHCSVCGKTQEYNCIRNLLEAIRNNTKCKECYHKSRIIPLKKNIKWIRNCPDCGKALEYGSRNSLTRSTRMNCTCKECFNKRIKLTTKIKRENEKQKSPQEKKILPKNIINNTIGSSFRYSIKFFSKNKKLPKNDIHYENIIGYKSEQLMTYIENLFTEDMSWDNYGDWQIDHIIPLSFFEFDNMNSVEFLYCWSLNNLRPMWRKDNVEKSDKITIWGKEINARFMERDYFSKIDSFHNN